MRIEAILAVGIARFAARSWCSARVNLELHDRSTRFVASLAARAGNEGLEIPDDVRRFLDVVDREPVFREGLAVLGFHFDEDQLGLGVLRDLGIAGFAPIWGNGHGDGYGGLTKDGAAFIWVDELTPSPLGSIAEYVRACAEEDEASATVELVLGVLRRERLLSRGLGEPPEKRASRPRVGAMPAARRAHHAPIAPRA